MRALGILLGVIAIGAAIFLATHMGRHIGLWLLAWVAVSALGATGGTLIDRSRRRAQ